MSKATELRALLSGDRMVRTVGARDGLSAKLVQEAGFDAVWASSFETSATHGLPDASLLTMTQFLDVAEAMNLVVDLPIVADCDTGFGGPLNVAYAVQRYEKRGIAAMSIEDKMFPKMNSFAATAQHLVSTEEFVQKIQAGKQAQESGDLLLIARTEALIAGFDLDEALRRAHAYADAGADAILVHSKSRNPDQVLGFGARWDRDVPLVAVPTTYPVVSEKDLYEVGYRLVIYANHGMRAAIKGMRATLADLARSDSAAGLEDSLASMAEVFALQNMPAAFQELA
ncbi:isocitrate lyase/phosphoenolpyruvate mutase family protein [Micromonospora sp. WMMD1120]|uniref:isocitrate lyase/phosphoenolpyruvate mutase family protein n=1 Tax=Micromonospora sp. WMMD1120 TaxID=3016106 RepID=UPI0024175DF6|nr:isocitrate lyase/phosphoenolpyruvate mutase family protein [Micromonospora sp. WMMD1120]MDG4810869.1 isocitrate lyase/phosphoenolpyruvate mutase family protein [Micromonospora sp. WMMD1120]